MGHYWSEMQPDLAPTARRVNVPLQDEMNRLLRALGKADGVLTDTGKEILLAFGSCQYEHAFAADTARDWESDVREVHRIVGLIAADKKWPARKPEYVAGTGISGDPWSNLSTYACSTCRFFVPKERVHPPHGRCRRHAPTLDGYPAVYGTDWCGDHKLGTNPSRS